MKETLDANWKPIGEIAAQMLAKMEDEQRRVFRRDVEQDGIEVQTQEAAE